jgi:5-hydroxyisourate hydrolase
VPEDLHGSLSTHVLDTARGCPAAGIPLTLRRGGAVLVRAVTNQDGRTDAPLAARGALQPGTYELEFRVADYFAGLPGVSEPPFLDLVTLRFTVGGAGHYHVPLLVSPWAYSTYRGS